MTAVLNRNDDRFLRVADRARRWWHHVPQPLRHNIWRVRWQTMWMLNRRWATLAVALAPRLPRRTGVGVTPEFTLLCIYRRRNIDHVVALCRAARAAGASIRLWSLDASTHPELAPHTIGRTPGDRPALLNTLERAAPKGPESWILVADDDIVIDGGLATFVAMAAAARFDIAQPAHSPRSNASFRHTLANPASLARRTEFVEIGPVIAVGPRARHLVFPMDESRLMGVGSELAWMDLRRRGIELGIIDCVTVEHLGIPGADYGMPYDQLERLTEAAGGHRRVRTVHATWYPHRRRPPWAGDASSG